MAGRELLEASIIWSIGNRKSTRLWKDKWIPRQFLNKVQSPITLLEEDAKVVELIHDPYWKNEVIQELFPSKDVSVIKSISFSPYDREDQLVWNYSKASHFTVRSAYYLHKALLKCKESGSSQGSGQEHAWKAIWKLKVLNGNKMFI